MHSASVEINVKEHGILCAGVEPLERITSLAGEGFWQDQQQIHMHLILMGALVHAKTTWSEMNPSTIMCMPFFFLSKFIIVHQSTGAMYIVHLDDQSLQD